MFNSRSVKDNNVFSGVIFVTNRGNDQVEGVGIDVSSINTSSIGENSAVVGLISTGYINLGTRNWFGGL